MTTVQQELLYRSPIGLYPFQVEGVVLAYERQDNLCVWDTGIGKQAPVSEPVLTPSGWVPIGQIRVGDQVYSQDGNPAEVLNVFPQESREVYRVTFSDGSWTRCGPDHLWQVGRWRWDRGVPRSARQRHLTTEVYTIAELLEQGIKTPSGRRKWRIPMCEPVQYPEANLPLDPYILGVLLGDAWIRDDGYIQITTDKELLDAIGLDSTRDNARSSPGIGVASTMRWSEAITELGLGGYRSADKFVPRQYLHASEGQRRDLLAGLLDTDGYPMDPGGVEFSSTSEALIDAVSELAESLGGQARRSGMRVTSYTHNGERRDGQPSWRVNVKLNTQPFRLTRKMVSWVEPSKYPVQRFIESIEKVEDEDSVCLRVDREDGLYLTRSHIVTHNSHLAMATAAMLFEDGLVDHVLVVCEKNKIEVDEWPGDFAKFTSLEVGIYHGAIPKRTKMREALPQVIISTYETVKNDCAKKVAVAGRKSKRLEPGPLTEALAGKRVMVVYDEMTKLGNRKSDNHKAHDLLIQTLRKSGWCKVLGLTATPIERNPENFYNLGRILIPDHIGTVANFEKAYIAAWDIFGNPSRFKNLTAEDMTDHSVTPLADVMRPILMRKRKTDPDVIDQFPSTVEDFTYINLGSRHQEFYETVSDTFEDADEWTQRRLFTTLRQIVGHPLALLNSEAEIAKEIVSQVGREGLRALGSAKTDRLVEYLDLIVNAQGAQAVVFAFFGPSMIPLLQEALTDAGISCALNHGQMSDRERSESKALFRSGKRSVFLTSDAGARGINLPEAQYVCVEANTPILNADMQWVPAWSLAVGDRVIGCDEELPNGGQGDKRRWQIGEVTENILQRRQCLRVILSNGDELVVTPEHRMLVRTGKGTMQWREAQELRVGWEIPRYLDLWEPGNTFDDGWVSGMADGEGCLSGTGRGEQLHIAQNPGPVWERLWKIVTGRGFDVANNGHINDQVRRLHILGGQAERMRWLGVFQPERLIAGWQQIVPGSRHIWAIEKPVVVSVEDAGIHEVAVMETTTRTFMGAGYMHHNCEYEMALTHANRVQRLNRIHRIDSTHPSVTFQSFVVRNTIEEGIANGVLRRNEWTDQLLDDDDPGEEFVTAAMRKRLLIEARARTV